MVAIVRRAAQAAISLAGVAAVTWAAKRSPVPINATTVGFAYLLLVLVIATAWGYLEAALASLAATLAFNFFFLPPVGRLTIADPQNWVAFSAFLATSLIAGRLSAEAKRRTLDALARQRDIARLYEFSRAILLTDKSAPFPAQLARRLSEVFEFEAVALYDGRAEEFYRAGPKEFDGLNDQLRQAAAGGAWFADAGLNRTITPIRLGAQPIAALGLQGPPMPDSVLQGIGNLVAIGLERAVAEDLASQVEAARRSEKLRTTLLDAMAHEFKTPLTSVIAATTALLDSPDPGSESGRELLKIADEEAHRLQGLIDDTVEMGRLDSTEIQVETEPEDIAQLAREVAASMRGTEDRPVRVTAGEGAPLIPADRRLVKLAIKQLLDNALKYSPPESPVTVNVRECGGAVAVEVTDLGRGIPPQEQKHVFERMYRGPSTSRRIPGSGLGLSIALSIARAHHGDLSFTSRPGETVFRLTLPEGAKGQAQ